MRLIFDALRRRRKAFEQFSDHEYCSQALRCKVWIRKGHECGGARGARQLSSLFHTASPGTVVPLQPRLGTAPGREKLRQDDSDHHLLPAPLHPFAVMSYVFVIAGVPRVGNCQKSVTLNIVITGLTSPKNNSSTQFPPPPCT